MRPQRFETRYLTGAGVMMLLAETYVVLVRMSDGHCRRLTYAELGM